MLQPSNKLARAAYDVSKIKVKKYWKVFQTTLGRSNLVLLTQVIPFASFLTFTVVMLKFPRSCTRSNMLIWTLKLKRRICCFCYLLDILIFVLIFVVLKLKNDDKTVKFPLHVLMTKKKSPNISSFIWRKGNHFGINVSFW